MSERPIAPGQSGMTPPPSLVSSDDSESDDDSVRDDSGVDDEDGINSLPVLEHCAPLWRPVRAYFDHVNR
jgi:hypothetical protein